MYLREGREEEVNADLKALVLRISLSLKVFIELDILDDYIWKSAE